MADFHVVMKQHRDVQDVDEFFPAGNVKGIALVEHKIKDNPNGPNVDAFVVLVPHQNFGAQVDRGPAKCSPQVGISVHAPPEIAQFHDPLRS